MHAMSATISLVGDFLVTKTSKTVKKADNMNGVDTENRLESREMPQNKKSSKEWE